MCSALADVGDAHARDRRQVAGHERQHAGRDEGDEADREGGDDGGVGLAGGERASDVVPREVLVQAPRRRRRSWPARAPGRARPPRSRPRRRQRGSSAASSAASPATTTTGTHQTARLKPLSWGLARIAGPVGALELGLDLLLGQPLGDEPADLGALLVGAVGLGDVQRHVARVAHDLVLDVVERRARLRAERRSPARARAPGRPAARPRRARISSACARSMARVQEVLRDLAARHRHHVAGACRGRRSRAASWSRTSARGRAGRRAGSGRSACTCARSRARRRRRPCRSRRAPCRRLPASLRCARSSTGASFSHGPHHEAQKFSTTTLPRSSASERRPGAVERRQRHPRAGRRRPLPACAPRSPARCRRAAPPRRRPAARRGRPPARRRRWGRRSASRSARVIGGYACATQAAVAQLVEHQLPKLRVASSSLVRRSRRQPARPEDPCKPRGSSRSRSRLRRTGSHGLAWSRMRGRGPIVVPSAAPPKARARVSAWPMACPSAFYAASGSHNPPDWVGSVLTRRASIASSKWSRRMRHSLPIL